MRITFGEALDRAVRRWWVVVALGLIGLALGGIYAAAAPKTYSASSYVTVAAVDPANSQAALGFAQAYGRIATAPQVLLEASTASGVPLPELATSARTSTSPDAPLIEITTRSVDAVRATNAANAIAEAFTAFGNARTPDTGMRVAVLSPAAVPVTPSSISNGAVLAIGAGAGVLVGALAVAAGIGALPARRRQHDPADDASAWPPPPGRTGAAPAASAPGASEPADDHVRPPEEHTPAPPPRTSPSPVPRRFDREPTTVRLPIRSLVPTRAGPRASGPDTNGASPAEAATAAVVATADTAAPDAEREDPAPERSTESESESESESEPESGSAVTEQTEAAGTEDAAHASAAEQEGEPPAPEGEEKDRARDDA